MTYPGYKPVKLLDVWAKIGGRQIYHSESRGEYAIERTHLGGMTSDEMAIFAGMRELEKADYDAQDRHDSAGKEEGQ